MIGIDAYKKNDLVMVHLKAVSLMRIKKYCIY